MAKFLSILLVGLFFQIYLIEPTVLQANTFRLNSVLIEGNKRISDEAISNYSNLTLNKEVSSDELNSAYKNIVDTGLFKIVEFKINNGNLLIVVDELPTVNLISFEGNKKFTDEKLLSFIKAKPRLYLLQLFLKKISQP